MLGRRSLAVEAGELFVDSPLELGIERVARRWSTRPCSGAASGRVRLQRRRATASAATAIATAASGSTQTSRLNPFFGGDASTSSPKLSMRTASISLDRVPGGDPLADDRAHAVGHWSVRELEGRVAGRADVTLLELGQRRSRVLLPSARGGQEHQQSAENKEAPAERCSSSGASSAARGHRPRFVGASWRAPHRFGVSSAACTFSSSCSRSNGPTMCSPTSRPSRPTNHVSGKPVLPNRPRLEPCPSNAIAYVSP